MSKPQIGIRYCGGCNPRYDRVGYVRKLQAEYPEFEFVNARDGEEYEAVLVVCGCLAQCAEHGTLTVRKGKVLLGAADHFKKTEAFLHSIKES